jgi:hypothetical protein
MLEIVVTCEKRTFTDEKGKSIEYYECIGEYCGQVIRFKVDTRDKSLLDYLYAMAQKPEK